MTFILPAHEAPEPPLDDELASDPQIAGFLHSARAHLGLEIGLIGRWVADETREITHVDSLLDLPLEPGLRQHREETYCWHVLTGELPEMIADPAPYPKALALHITEALPVGTHFSVPLRLSDGTVWGSFCAMGRTPDPTLTGRDLAIFEGFAAMAAERIDTLIAEAARREQTRQRIEDMFEGDAVTIFQQPIHQLADGKPVGVECLARFPDVNKRSPGAWFGDAESTGLGEELEMTAVRGAIETLAGVPEGFFAAIKAPARCVVSGAVRAALEAEAPADVIVTLTQYAAAEDKLALVQALEAIRPTARVAIDMVGTSYASMQLAALVKPDFVKLDMALARNVATDPAARALVSAVVALVSEWNGAVVAEGIEESAQAEAMQSLGVSHAQGYLFARPMPMVAAAQHLAGIVA
ncbi:sensor domain-containing phosphodiesterase [Aurantiacibacter suaedae]|uniref:sensor domain-containing phosphodiesterase n=1 Tax=Aurantiacibacter suaedae TaxID=2545755 RepID=UPI001386FA4D|nr:EAL domain-containing protein [Aurantiacibacter suaedae]